MLQVLAGIEAEITSLHELLQVTSSTVGASTAASKQLQQLHQVEVHRLQSEIETHRSKGLQLASDISGITQKYEAQILKLQDDVERCMQAEAAAKQALSRDRWP
jgi:predicted  nucleic acid-binding Zn-ribbon protein